MPRADTEGDIGKDEDVDMENEEDENNNSAYSCLLSYASVS